MDNSDWKIDRRWIWGLTALALLTRIIGLDGQLWADEVLSLVRYVRKDLQDLFLHFYSNNQHPLYSLLARITMDIFGESAWTLRLPAALMGTACIPALYALGTRVTTKREAFLSASLLAVSYHQIWFSQNARGYTAIMLGAIVCTFLLIRGIEEKSPKDFVLYGLVAGLGAYTHLGMVLCVVGQAAFLVPWMMLKVRPPKAWIWPLAAFPLGGAFTLLFHAPMLTEVIDFFLNKPSPAVGLATPLWALMDALGSLAQGFGGGVVAVGAVVVLVIGAVGLLGLVSYAKTKPMALGLFLFPVLITGMGVMGGRGIVYPRFFFGVAAFGILIFLRGPFVLGRLIAKGRGQPEGQNRLGVALVALMLLGSAASVPINYLYPKQDFEGAIAHIEAQRGPDDAVACLGIIRVINGGYYKKDWPKIWSTDELRAAAQGKSGLWVTFMMADYIKHVNPDVMTYVRAHCKDMKRFAGTLRGGAVYTCRVPTDNGQAPASAVN
jgi:mannosyltransferase